ncbi:modification methylase [Corallococcus coralloides]|uniref:site-specific DNA-methyltransferase (adenine-specific) n=2 Tax=Corallococcus coralloides TaxID=184914 RepID=A0A410S4J1_CORCK|nr:modification methylase [Corallococcus coralloides]
MAQPQGKQLKLLDAGAGVGSLTAAWIAHVCTHSRPPSEIHAVAFEIEPLLIPYLETTLELCRRACMQADVRFTAEIRTTDFIKAGIESLRVDLFRSGPQNTFDVVIMNPPYRKTLVASEERALLDSAGLGTTNLYTAFLSIAVRLLSPGGELIAITPRSFCNGTYFRGFRKDFLSRVFLQHIHLFETRDQAFGGDEVLQENIIFRAVHSEKPLRQVVISTSSDAESHDMQEREISYDQVIRPDDPDQFIRLTTDGVADEVSSQMGRMSHSLEELGIAVSTGKVVDFRSKESLRKDPGPNTAPLIYPGHFHEGFVQWPRVNFKKANALVQNNETQNLLVPSGVYVLVKRFSSKEESRRVVAAVYDPLRMPERVAVGFENHLNYFHDNGKGLPLDLAKGLAIFLNSTVLDLFFRQLSGHTQVNAGDLRNMRYPSRSQLLMLGKRVLDTFPTQSEIDQLVNEVLFPVNEVKALNPLKVTARIEEAKQLLSDLGMPREQLNDRSALTLLALADLRPETPWSQASAPLCGITPIMDFMREWYGKSYKPNTRETVRRFTVHQFLDAGFIVSNPDQPKRPTNSPKAVYQMAPAALELLRKFGTPRWGNALIKYLGEVGSLREKYNAEREMNLIPVRLDGGEVLALSPGGQNVLVKQIIEEFCPRFTPSGIVAYIGDTENKHALYGREYLAGLGVVIEDHGKMPDVVVHHVEKNWLVLIEAVTSHGPVNSKRRGELQKLFKGSKAGLVFVTAFLNRQAMVRYLPEISWETEVWVADAPSHLIHFNGERFLGPYEE